ncbi:ribosomal protein L23 [Musa troglodytarum]|uniref:Ribosomal Proteins L2, RNA binding domain n=2 Tax=Musa troglodytarum TaxID=320322 RepID=A0A9E7F9A9_9LILI|nr:Ribosomal Proteins L2, RNA binding domain [Musa troglodytarum]URE21011.1 ribosomal protein L23 [Musa troglodytarum]
MDSIVVVKVVMPEESLPHGIEGEVISVYTVKSIFDGMKKTYLVESGAIIGDTIVSGTEVPISMGNALPLSAV